MERPKTVVFLQGEKLCAIQLLEGRGHSADGLRSLAPGPALLQPAEHGDFRCPLGHPRRLQGGELTCQKRGEHNGRLLENGYQFREKQDAQASDRKKEGEGLA